MRAAVRDQEDHRLPLHHRRRIQGTRKTMTTPPTLPQLETIVEAMPDLHRAMMLLAAWCALRFGELIELRRDDIDLEAE